MSDTRSSFSLPLYGALQGVIVLGYALRPSWYRPLMFIPIGTISFYLIFYTTAGTTTDVGMGCAIAAQMLYAFDFIVLTDIQRTFHRIGEKPGQIMSAPFTKRLAWSWHLCNSPRGVGKAFILSRIFTMCICALVQGFFTIVNAVNPALVPGATPLVHQSLYIRALSLFGLGLTAFAQINLTHCLASAVLVGAGISQPADWPPIMGSLSRMYTVQHFWRLVWHQLLRRPILSISNFLLHTILRLPRISSRADPSIPSIFIGILRLNTAFLLSALTHYCGEYMMLGRVGTGAFWFFIAQPWIITLEIATRYLFTGETHSNEKPPPLIWRLLGYIWVISWFIAVAPLMQQPMIDAGMFIGPSNSALARNIGRWLALDVI